MAEPGASQGLCGILRRRGGEYGLAGQNGGQGGWAVLYGLDPLPNGAINLAVEEETVDGDTSRSHTNEEIDYGVFRNNQTAEINVTKTVDISPVSSASFATPGSDMLYTLEVESVGTAPADEDSLFLVAAVPDEVTFYNGDIDDGGPETGTIQFVNAFSGVTFNEATDLRFSNAIAKPNDISDCTYSPVAGYDPAVRHICFSPKGQLLGGAIQPNAEFSLTYRCRID